MFGLIKLIIIMISLADNKPIIFLHNILIISGITQQHLWGYHIEILFVMLRFISYLESSDNQVDS